MPGEFEFVQWLRAQQSKSELVAVPAGDDLAVLRWPADQLLLVGADQVLDGRHFDSRIHSPWQIGRKAMNRNLSDCAAMACLPIAAVATVALPAGVGLEYSKELYLGIRDAADLFDCQVVGGDTGSWDGKLAMSVTIFGASRNIPPVRRNGANPGDGIYVTGPLGGSILGRHMTFTPRVALARKLVASGNISSMIDLSDGLSRDLAHICRESGVGATLNMTDIPVHQDAIELAGQKVDAGKYPWPAGLDHALNDGEDYELLFTGQVATLPAGVVRIGEIVAEPGIRITDPGGVPHPIQARGWEHSL